jgi:hypothetical protein
MRFLSCVFAACLIAGTASGQQLIDVPDIAKDEITRRGDLVTHTEQRTGGTQAFTEATTLPADDSHKWFLTVVTAPDCQHCARLKADLAKSPLKAWVDLQEAAKSWSHFHEYVAGDETQEWRWKQIKIGGYPTILVQPPIDGQYGDPATVVFQQTGYDGDAEKLSTHMSVAIRRYTDSLAQRRVIQGGHRQVDPSGAGQPVIGVDPPFTPVSPLPNPTPYPNPYPSPYPTVPPLPTPQPVPQPSLGGMLATLLGGMLGSNGLQTFILLAILGLAGVRTFRKATNQPLLLDDAAFESMKKMLTDLAKAMTPNASGPSDQPPNR